VHFTIFTLLWQFVTQAQFKASMLIFQFNAPAASEAGSGFTLELPTIFRHL